MSKDRLNLVRNERVFLSSPNDVTTYRDIVEKTINILNEDFLEERPQILSLISSDDVTSNFGAHPQTIIDDQVADNYDLIIVIFHARIGTPTSEYDSGTVQEFYTAFNRLKTRNDVEIQMYLCDDSLPPSHIDGKQFFLLSEFKRNVSQEGLWKEFKGKSDFQKKLKSGVKNYLNNSLRKIPKNQDAANVKL